MIMLPNQTANLRINGKTFAEIMENHKKWLAGDPDGKQADLTGIDLSFLYLIDIDLSKACLSGTNFTGSYLENVCFSNACLNRAIFTYAKLSSVDLTGANIQNADFCRAVLRNVNFCNVDRITTANLAYACPTYVRNVPYYPLACPEVGSFIGFKKANNLIIVLEIPKGAKRSSAFGRKCRCNKAKVLEIQHLDGSIASVNAVPSDYDKTFIYKVGETVTVKDFCRNRWVECAQGIHFFINRQEAVDY